MLQEHNLAFGFLFILGGFVLLYFNFNNKTFNKNRPWDWAMLFKGAVGGLSLIAIGIVLITT